MLLAAAGLTIDTMPRTKRNLHAIRDLLDEGFDLQGDVLPVIRRLAHRKAKTWKYYVPAIQEAESGSEAVPVGRLTIEVLPNSPLWVGLAERLCIHDPTTGRLRGRRLPSCPTSERSGGWRFPATWVTDERRKLGEAS